MAVAQRHDGVGQYGFGHPFSRMAPPSSFPNFGHDRRPMDEHSEPLWPVPRIQQQHQMGQGSAPDRSRDLAGFSSSFPQPDVLRQSGHQANYTYDGSSSALRNPVVYSQPAQLPWGAAGQSSEYTEYPTASFVTPIGQRAPLHTQPPYLGATNGAYDSSLHSGSDAFPKLMNGSASGMGSAYDHPAETLWPLGPNSLDAFAGIPAPTGQVARLTLTSASDKNKFKQRSSLPPPKQFKCSACDAIFSRNTISSVTPASTWPLSLSPAATVTRLSVVKMRSSVTSWSKVVALATRSLVITARGLQRYQSSSTAKVETLTVRPTTVVRASRGCVTTAASEMICTIKVSSSNTKVFKATTRAAFLTG